MENKVFLNIDTNRGLVVIPFESLRKLDLFTVGYNNKEELVDSLSRMLDLSLNVDDVLNIYISGNRYKHTRNDSLNYIKYSDDNYNIDSLSDMLSLYLKQDHRRIRYCDVRFVNIDSMLRFNAGYPINDREIDLAVKIFLNKDYKKQRDMYFMIKSFGNVRSDKLSKGERERLVLSEMNAQEDSFVQYLVELASRDKDKLVMALDELSKVDLEDISRLMDGKNYAPFDGLVNDKEDDLEEDIYALEMLTDLSIEEIKDLQLGYSFGRSR